ncbi:MAG: type II toxin-antitoxin system Phd/YefM family antitoxin [Pseudomonadota bacterium]
MPFTVMKSSAFKISPTRAKKAAIHAPVFITEYGKPAYVMLNIEAYRKLIGDTGHPAAIKDIDAEFSNLFDKTLMPSRSE